MSWNIAWQGIKIKRDGGKKEEKEKEKMATKAKLEFCVLYSSPLLRVNTEKNLKMP
jgi:hypothetical protein